MKNYPPNFLDVAPNSPEWLRARIGHVTASRVADVIGKKAKGGYYADRAKYMGEIIAEMLTGTATEHYVTAEMQWGIDNETLARTAYEMETGLQVERVGFVLHPTIARCGSSPDGLIGKDGGVEFKCPMTTTHIGYRIARVVPLAYRPQMFLNMDCCEREWWDFYSYDPRLKDEIAGFRMRLYRDEKKIAEIRDEIEMFLDELATQALKATEPIQPEQSLEDKLRASIKEAKGYHPDDPLTVTKSDAEEWVTG